ncbi:MAG: DUF4159 domain-containing protein [Acidobacteriota bacterium]|nr:DUF4159 domain-containing protein [Acidobacteriota bacterium]
MLDNNRIRAPVFWISVIALSLTSIAVSPRSDGYLSKNDPTHFQFARVKFNESGRFFWAGWAHDYPRAEQNLLKIISETTSIKTTPNSYSIVELDDPRIMEYPLLYFSEPGTWAVTPEEVKNLREYFMRGGFAIFDDFDGPWQWAAFEASIKAVFPERQMERLTVDSPIFQCFYELETLEMTAPRPYGYSPEFYGMFDATGRLQIIVNFNNDIGDYWEWSDTSFFPVSLSNEAYKLGINYVVYALTH